MTIKFLFNSLFGFLFSFIFSVSCLQGQDSPTPYVLVSVSPYKFFVEHLTGETIKVGVMVPAGASAHTYEPTPKQMLMASTASIWFRTGEPFENRAIQALQEHNPKLKVVDLRQGIDLIYDHEHGHSCCPHGADLHFWLSPYLAKIQASHIAEVLTQVYPEHAERYRENLKKFHEELDHLDQQIKEVLQSIKNRHILVSHPAYAYFCRDYGLKQYSIEFEGKDPTPQQLTKTLNLARKLNLKTIYIQPQYSSKGARLVAEQIGAKVVTLNPYSEHYITSMLEIAHAFAKG